jgi:hypothetical protein
VRKFVCCADFESEKGTFRYPGRGTNDSDQSEDTCFLSCRCTLPVYRIRSIYLCLSVERVFCLVCLFFCRYLVWRYMGQVAGL